MTAVAPTGAGVRMFARYAYAPNELGYCGPPEAAVLRHGTDAEIRRAAARFSGAWPYLRVLSRMTGIADPMDYRLVESYWLGGGIGARLDPAEFTAELLALIGPLAGGYWTHLDAGLAGEAAPNHCFHVLGVYPWSRLLAGPGSRQALHILDNCRISWGTVVSAGDSVLSVRTRSLCWTGQALEQSAPYILRVDRDDTDPEVAPGAGVALHWGRVCGALTPTQEASLRHATTHQLTLTNPRLAAPA